MGAAHDGETQYALLLRFHERWCGASRRWLSGLCLFTLDVPELFSVCQHHVHMLRSNIVSSYARCWTSQGIVYPVERQ